MRFCFFFFVFPGCLGGICWESRISGRGYFSRWGHRGVGIEMLASRTAATQTRVDPEKLLGKEFPKWAWIGDFGWHGFGVEFLGQRKRAEKVHVESTPASEPKLAPFWSKIHARIRGSKSRIHGAPTLASPVLARSVVVFEALRLENFRRVPSAREERAR